MAWLRRARQVLIVAMLAFAGANSWVFSEEAKRTSTTEITVFAAASLKNALDAIASDYLQATGNKVKVSYAASSTLAKQIEAGAPADLFISADLDWMDYLDKKGLIKKESVAKLLGNRIVLVGPANSTLAVKISKDFPLAEAIGNGRLAMADVKAVPAGKYGKAALEKLGVWPAVEAKIAQAENVRAALALVASGEAPLGIVYETDAHAEPKVKILDVFPDDTHPAIVYPVAVTTAAKSADAASAFENFLKGSTAQKSFIKEGFTILN
jgi:molybdate transport system substrate-binding protein